MKPEVKVGLEEMSIGKRKSREMEREVAEVGVGLDERRMKETTARMAESQTTK